MLKPAPKQGRNIQPACYALAYGRASASDYLKAVRKNAMRGYICFKVRTSDFGNSALVKTSSGSS